MPSIIAILFSFILNFSFTDSKEYTFKPGGETDKPKTEIIEQDLLGG